MPDFVLLAQKIAIWALPVLFTFTGQAIATAQIAHRLGDPTPAQAGRLSLNPFAHLDWMGTVIVPLLCIVLGGFVIGWPKSVPMNPAHFARPRHGLALVSLLALASNLAMAVLWSVLLKAVLDDGTLSPIFMGLQMMAGAGIAVNLAFLAISLLPIPPLPGGLLLKSLIAERHARQIDRLEPHLALILIILVIGGIFTPFVSAVMGGFQNFIFTLLGISDYRAF